MNDVLGRAPRRWLWASVLALGLGACSDDGLSPQAAADSAAGSTSGAEGVTSNVDTSATITASADGGSGITSSPPGDTGGDSTGPQGGEGTTSGQGTGTGEEVDSGDGPGTTGEDGPPCVASDDCVCDPGEVICEVVPPVCPPGTVPEVDPGAMCWTFACVPPDSCESVPDCMACGRDLACVGLIDLGGLFYTCEPIPPACMDVPSCGCMPDACPMPYECVGMPPGGGADLGCTCDVC